MQDSGSQGRTVTAVTVLPPYEGVFEADKPHSTYMLTVTHMQVARFSAPFEDVDALLSITKRGFDFHGVAQVRSLRLRHPRLRKHVVYGQDFFDARRFPTIDFRSRDAFFFDDWTFSGSGELTIRSITRQVPVTGTYRPIVTDPFGGVRTGLELSAQIDRREWGLDWQHCMPDGSDVVSYLVDLNAQIELVRREDPNPG